MFKGKLKPFVPEWIKKKMYHTSDGGTVRGFELAGADRVFYPTEAHIEGEAVVLLLKYEPVV